MSRVSLVEYTSGAYQITAGKGMEDRMSTAKT